MRRAPSTDHLLNCIHHCPKVQLIFDIKGALLTKKRLVNDCTLRRREDKSKGHSVSPRGFKRSAPISADYLFVCVATNVNMFGGIARHVW